MSPLNEVLVPANTVKIDPSAFSAAVWRNCIRYEGPPLFVIDDDLICSVDSNVIFRSLSCRPEFLIGSNIEVIASYAFYHLEMSAVLFESGSRLREIGSAAFARCEQLTKFTIPESGDIIGDRSFQSCSQLKTVTFEGSSKLKRIGERAFSGCKLDSIRIPALTEEIDGSAFVDCPLIAVQVAPGSLNFKV
jgi:hypothetical protein